MAGLDKLKAALAAGRGSDFDLRARRALNAASHVYSNTPGFGKPNVMHRAGANGKEYLLAINTVYTIDDFAELTEDQWAAEGLKLVRVSGTKYAIEEI